MSAQVSNVSIASFTAASKQLNKGWVKSYIELDALKNIQKNKFAVLVPDFLHNHILIKGSLTWGISGFSFSINTQLKGQTPPILTIFPHNNCDIEKDVIEGIVMDLIEMANNKVFGNQTILRGKYRAPRLKAVNRSIKISLKSRENIERFKSMGVFDHEFSMFMLRHESDGIRCDG